MISQSLKIFQAGHLKWFIFLIALAVAISIPWIIDLVISLGVNIRLDDIPKDYFFGCLWGLIFLFIVMNLPLDRAIRNALVNLWLVRCLVTLVAMLFYEYSYGLDAYMYYEEADGTPPNPIGKTGTPIIIFIVHWMHRLLPFSDSYHATKVIFSFAGFIGAYIFFEALRLLYPLLKLRWLYIISLCPSILFWSSILGKDPLSFLGICIYCYGLFGLFEKKDVKYFLILCLGAGLASIVRAWSAPILLAPLLIWFLILRPKWIFALIPVFIFTNIPSQIVAFISAKLKIETIDDLLEQTQKVSHSWAIGGSGQQAPDFSDVQSVVRFLPSGMFAALFRPLPGEIMNPFGILAGLENLTLLVLFIFSIRQFGKKLVLDKNHLLVLLILLIWSGIYGFISFQNLGSGVRFRLQAMPFLIYFIVNAYQNRDKNNGDIKI